MLFGVGILGCGLKWGYHHIDVNPKWNTLARCIGYYFGSHLKLHGVVRCCSGVVVTEGELRRVIPPSRPTVREGGANLGDHRLNMWEVLCEGCGGGGSCLACVTLCGHHFAAILASFSVFFFFFWGQSFRLVWGWKGAFPLFKYLRTTRRWWLVISDVILLRILRIEPTETLHVGEVTIFHFPHPLLIKWCHHFSSSDIILTQLDPFAHVFAALFGDTTLCRPLRRHPIHKRGGLIGISSL